MQCKWPWLRIIFLESFSKKSEYIFNLNILYWDKEVTSMSSFFFFVVNFVIHWNEIAMGLHVFPIPIPPPTTLSTPSHWVFPVHQVRALVSCIQPGLVICFTLDNIHVSMLFSWNIPPSPSPTEWCYRLKSLKATPTTPEGAYRYREV